MAQDGGEKAAINTLNGYLSRYKDADGGLNVDTLRRAASGEFGPDKADFQRSAQYFLDHPEQLKALDTARGAGPTPADGYISEGNLYAREQQFEPPMMRENALSMLDELDRAFFNSDGFLTKETLQKGANGGFGEGAQQQAAQYFLDHPDEFTALETAWGTGEKHPDGLASYDDLLTARGQPVPYPGTHGSDHPAGYVYPTQPEPAPQTNRGD